MQEINFVNKARALNYMVGVLKAQQSDPLCVKCKSFGKTVERLRSHIQTIEKGIALDSLPNEYKSITSDALTFLKTVSLPSDPIPQRKVGHCAFPDKKCCIKHVRKFLDTTFDLKHEEEK